MKKPSIPSVMMLPPQLAQVLGPMKENLEIMNGSRGNPLVQLPGTASNAEIIATINSIIARLNATGT